MAQYFSIHPKDPQARLIRQAVDILARGGVIVYPTDSCYAFGCHLDDKDAVARIRALRGIDDRHHLTLVCRDLAQIAKFARVDNTQYRLLKANTPGGYTFILEATREVPRRLQHPRRSTIGLRVPDHPVALALLEAHDAPLLSSTLILPGDDGPLTDPEDIRERLEHGVDLVIDAGNCGSEMTTVIDLTGSAPELVRRGRGAIAPFGFA